MNLNNLARDITLKEGMKKSVSIAQVKEIMKITFKELAKKGEREIINTILRYK